MKYSPDQALDANIGQLELAIDGLAECLRKTNPFRSQKDIDEEKTEEMLKGERVDAPGAAAGLLAWAQRMNSMARPPEKPKQN